MHAGSLATEIVTSSHCQHTAHQYLSMAGNPGIKVSMGRWYEWGGRLGRALVKGVPEG